MISRNQAGETLRYFKSRIVAHEGYGRSLGEGRSLGHQRGRQTFRWVEDRALHKQKDGHLSQAMLLTRHDTLLCHSHFGPQFPHLQDGPNLAPQGTCGGPKELFISQTPFEVARANVIFRHLRWSLDP